MEHNNRHVRDNMLVSRLVAPSRVQRRRLRMQERIGTLALFSTACVPKVGQQKGTVHYPNHTEKFNAISIE